MERHDPTPQVKKDLCVLQHFEVAISLVQREIENKEMANLQFHLQCYEYSDHKECKHNGCMMYTLLER